MRKFKRFKITIECDTERECEIIFLYMLANGECVHRENNIIVLDYAGSKDVKTYKYFTKLLGNCTFKAEEIEPLYK